MIIMVGCHNYCILNLSSEVGKLISHIKDNDGVRVPQRMQGFIKVVQDVIRDLLMNPLRDDWCKPIDNLRQSNISNRTKARHEIGSEFILHYANDSTEALGRTGARGYAVST
jgi:hypothetical protein